MMMNKDAGVAEVSQVYQVEAAERAVPIGYKQTEVGVIPEDWKADSLHSIAVIERGKFSARPRNDPRYYGGEYPFLQTGDVTHSKGRIKSFTQTLNDEGIAVSRLFPSGTLFFTIAANIGDVGIADFEAACPDSLVGILPRGQTSKNWLLYELASRKEEFELLASPGAQLNINLEKLRPFVLPVPPIKEQTAIANALSDVDSLLSELEKLIAKKQAIKTATMQQLLTGRTRLPQFALREDGAPKGYKQSELGKVPEDWDVRPLGCLTHIKTGTSNNQDKVPDGLYPFFVRSERIELINSFSHDCEAILVPGEGGIGSIYHYINGKFDAHQRVYVISQFIDCDGKFIYFQMRQRFGSHAMENSVKATVDSLRLPTFKEFSVFLPSIEEQTAIATIFSNMDEEIQALEQRLSKTRQIKQGMMQELLTGKIRLLQPPAVVAEHSR
jgi:type I restriction enzyme S subunit